MAFTIFHAVRCAGTPSWCPAEVSRNWHPWDVLRSLYLCGYFELGLFLQHSVSQPHDSFLFQQGKTKTFSSEDSSGQQIRGRKKIYIYPCVNKPCLFLLTFWCDFGAPSFSPNKNTHFKLSAVLVVWEGLFGIAVCTAENQPWLPWLSAKQWPIKISCFSRRSVDYNPSHSKGNVCSSAVWTLMSVEDDRVWLHV